MAGLKAWRRCLIIRKTHSPWVLASGHGFSSCDPGHGGLSSLSGTRGVLGQRARAAVSCYGFGMFPVGWGKEGRWQSTRESLSPEKQADSKRMLFKETTFMLLREIGLMGLGGGEDDVCCGRKKHVHSLPFVRQASEQSLVWSATAW